MNEDISDSLEATAEDLAVPYKGGVNGRGHDSKSSKQLPARALILLTPAKVHPTNSPESHQCISTAVQQLERMEFVIRMAPGILTLLPMAESFTNHSCQCLW